MSASLSVLAPVTITAAQLFSSTVPETDYTAWSSATTYAAGARCISTTTHRIYESVSGSNTAHDPTDINNRAGSVVWWIDVDPTNKWAMFDGEVSTQTAIASPLTVVIRAGYFNSFYLAGLDAETIAVTIKSSPGGPTIYSYSGPLEGSMPADYYEHWFDRFKPQTDFLASGIDPYNDAELTITLTKGSGLVKCGVLALGDLRPLGETQHGAKAKPKTYSYIKTDDYGKTKIVRRKATTDMSASAGLHISEANTVLQLVKDLLDVPCVWIGTDLPEYSGLRVFGLGSGELSYDESELCQLSLNVQGVI